MCTLWGLALAKKSCNNINDSRASFQTMLFLVTKLLTAIFKNNIETKEYSKFVETYKWFLLKRNIVLEYSKTVRRKKICWLNTKNYHEIDKQRRSWIRWKVSSAGESVVRLVLKLFQCFKYACLVSCLFVFMGYWTEADAVA